MLGILNDDWNAYTYYATATRTERGRTTFDGNRSHQAIVDRWRRKVETDWDIFKNWSVTESFLDMVEGTMKE